MATTPPDQTVTSGERLWSDEVGLARSGELPGAERVDVYEWSNGRRFKEGLGPYSGNDQQPGQGS